MLDPALLIESLTEGSGLSTGPVTPNDPDTVHVIIDSAGTVVLSAEALPLVARVTVGDAASAADIVLSHWGVEVPVEAPREISEACD